MGEARTEARNKIAFGDEFVGNRRGEAETLTDFGNVNLNSGQPQKALGCYQQALSIRKAIKDKQATFISRGDNSGTHLFELMIWNKDVGINIQKQSGSWYQPIERGMEGTLRIARARDAYVLSDRGTWISFKSRGDLQILVEGDRRMFNQYGVILVNPDKHPNVKTEFGQAFIDWLVSPEGQRSIANYKIDGEELFYPNADDPNA